MSGYIPYTSDSLGLTVQEMVYSLQSWLDVAPGDYIRYPLAACIGALNAGASQFAKDTKCLTMPVLMVMAGNVQNYALPHSVLKITAARYYYGDDRQSYQELDILTDARRMQMEDSVYRGYAGSPATYLYPSYKNNDLIQFGISPYPDTDGTSFNAVNSGVVVLNAGIWPTTLPANGPWGLAIDVPAGTCSVIAAGTDDLGTSIGAIGDFSAFTDNLWLDVSRRPVPMSATALTYVCELPYDYHDAVVCYAVWRLGRQMHNGVSQPDKAVDAKKQFAEYVEQYNTEHYQDESMSEIIDMDWLT